MAFTKILDSDVADKGVIGLPDTPNLSTQAMQEKFDEIALDVLKPKHNELIDELEASTAAASLGAMKNGEATTVQNILDDMSAQGYTKQETDVLLSGKVDKEEGKGLSTYDFSDGYKYKIDNIEDNANNYVLPIATADSLGGIKPDNETATVDINGVLHVVGGGGGGTADYEALINQPVINGVTLFGDNPSEHYGLLRPYLLITSDAGSTVTITDGTSTITATQVAGSTTQWECNPTSYGTWTVKSELAGADDAVTTVDIDAVKTYAVTVSHMTATITVTYPAGATSCTLTKGDLTYTATENPQAFTVRSAGTWTVTCVYNGITKTATAIISSDGDSQSVTIEYASITVNYGNDFKGKTITCTDGLLTYTKVAPNDASSISFTIPNTGTWTVSATVSGVPYSQTVSVVAYTSYSTTLEVFEAIVTITFPYSNGATCTITDGDTTLSADESPMAFSIPNTGTWTTTCTLDGVVKTQSFVITTDGQTESYTFSYGTINLTYANEFRGLSITCTDGVTTITKTAPISGNTMAFYPPNTGTWAISGIYSGVTYSTGNITVSSLSTAVSATLQTIPNGSTVTPTDNVQKLLNCAGIFDKNYTTIAQLLADSTSLLTVISSNNAVDYLVRSTTFASSVCANSTAMTDIGANDYCASTLLGDSTWCTAICNSTYFESVLTKKVPTMTSNTTPSGTCFGDGIQEGDYYNAFDGNSSTKWYYTADGGVGYQFTASNKCKKVVITLGLQVMGAQYQRADEIKIQANNSGDTWNTLKTDTSHGNDTGTKTYTYVLANNNTAYKRYKVSLKNSNVGYGLPYVYSIQFYGR